MLFMLVVKASTQSEAGRLPSDTLMEAMSRYNEELEDAGIRVMARGLHPSSNGLRLYYGEDGTISKTEEGPFENPNDLIAGFIIIDVASKEDAIMWAKKMPDPQGLGEGQIELRQIHEF